MDREADRQLAALLADPDYQRVLTWLVRLVKRYWGREDGGRVALSALGEPRVLAAIRDALLHVRPGDFPSLAAVIMRRRVFGLLEKDATRPGHEPLPPDHHAIDADGVLGTAHAVSPDDPATQLHEQRACKHVQNLLTQFGEIDDTTRRQADLLTRHFFDEVDCIELAQELECTENAARVRVHVAKGAFLRFVTRVYPQLLKLLAGWRT